jgi:hypothetical protein
LGQAEAEAGSVMAIEHLSFDIPFDNVDTFLDHWSSRYGDETGRDKKYYEPYTGKGVDLRTDERRR